MLLAATAVWGWTFVVVKDARSQRIGRVVALYGHRLLQNHRAVVVLVVGKMNGAAAQLRTIFEHRLVNVMTEESFPAKRGNQARVNVDDPIHEIRRNRQALEKPAHHD
jgi:hypothetical protein